MFDHSRWDADRYTIGRKGPSYYAARADHGIINHAHRAGYEEGPSEGAVDVGKAPLGPLEVALI